MLKVLDARALRLFLSAGLLTNTLTNVTASIEDQVMFYRNMTEEELKAQKAEKEQLIKDMEEKKIEIQEVLKDIGEDHKAQMKALMEG